MKTKIAETDNSQWTILKKGDTITREMWDEKSIRDPWFRNLLLKNSPWKITSIYENDKKAIITTDKLKFPANFQVIHDDQGVNFLKYPYRIISADPTEDELSKMKSQKESTLMESFERMKKLAGLIK